MEQHLNLKTMWAYVQVKRQLTLEELAHLSECEQCLSLFKHCALALSETHKKAA